MKNRSQVNAKLLEIEYILRMPQDDMMAEFSIPYSVAAYSKLMPLGLFVQPHGRSMTRSLVRIQVVGRAEGWLDCLHWIKGDPPYIRQHTMRRKR